MMTTTLDMPAIAFPDDNSDYGDFDDADLEIVDQLLAQVASDASLLVADIEDYEPPQGVRLPKSLGYEPFSTQAQIDIQVLRDQATDIAQSPPQDPDNKDELDKDKDKPTEPDDRPPIERFRKPPKKALSVTDLVSPAWCELQYFYILSKHGRKKRTPAMKQGSAVHQALEDEVHITVPIEVTKKEDSWGLRIWNIIQGLRTLRETGRTRELEVWGTVGGEIVNGIIDELSYTCPDPKYEETLQTKKTTGGELPEYQKSITEYLLSAGQKEDNKVSESSAQDEKWIYITDVKTRGVPTLPAGSSIRPTVLQLHLYHHMLENLAQGNFKLSLLTDRYGLDDNETFSDSFLAQLGNLNQDVLETTSSQEGDQSRASQTSSSPDSLDMLLRHNTLSLLWDHMMSEFRTTFLLSTSPPDADEPPTPTPQSVSELAPPPSQPTRLSSLLTAEYLSPTYQHKAGAAKGLLGRKSFGFDAAFLKAYLEDSLAWWRGERGARGVELQDAWKCRRCDFRDDCAWIHERDKASLEEAMERKRMREIAGVEKKRAVRSQV